ncbi:hypothetical protein CEXT_378534 [Caerostris extrusa]|uniref:Multiple epidermal growth factor-like domains protein 10 n=1 Tax=Caerostris extrusa TaxID=172846 RepID=A0AAV4TC96_CAEEX|nr:hypothetical protein CEXT_378534 [Caerostris extrusa]
MHWSFILVFAVLATLIFIAEVSPLEPSGSNTCTKSVSYTKTQTVTYIVSASKSYTTWCASLPPRCTKYRTYYYTKSRIESNTEQKIVRYCCSGYLQEDDHCTPICTSSCNNQGTCVSPNICDCNAGWMGSTCSTKCPEGRYGKGCSNKCVCKNGATCNKVDGSCLCTSGWQGSNCGSKCNEGRFGQNCTQSCKCKNGAKCNAVDGSCDCPPGYKGKTCEELCGNGKWGKSCFQNCSCMNGAKCLSATGQCICTPGWQGSNCDSKCDEGRFGQSCSESCKCKNGAQCNAVDGSCDCPPGYKGKTTRLFIDAKSGKLLVRERTSILTLLESVKRNGVICRRFVM